jgi:hypothetical protein
LPIQLKEVFEMLAKPKHTHYRPGALATAGDVRQELAKLYRDARRRKAFERAEEAFQCRNHKESYTDEPTRPRP